MNKFSLFVFLLCISVNSHASELNKKTYAEQAYQWGETFETITTNLGKPTKTSSKALELRYNQTLSELVSYYYPHLTITLWQGQFGEESKLKSKELLESVSFNSCLSIKISPCFIGLSKNELIQYFGQPNKQFSTNKHMVYMVPFGDGGSAPIGFYLENSLVVKTKINTYFE